MNNIKIIDNNKVYWDEHADLWFGTTALPQYGVKFVTEDDLHLFGDVSGKKQNDRETMESTEVIGDKSRKAKMIPISVCFKARKL